VLAEQDKDLAQEAAVCQQEQMDIEDTAVPYKAEVVAQDTVPAVPYTAAVVAQDTVPNRLEDTALLSTVVDYLVSLVPCQPLWLLHQLSN